MSQDRVDRHNRIATQVVRLMLEPLRDSKSGDFASTMVLLESVICGVLSALFKYNGDDTTERQQAILAALAEGVSNRLAEAKQEKRNNGD